MPYSGVINFGDSLVDSGNVLGLAEWYDDLPFAGLPDGAPTEEDGYFRGRFTNGYTFADLLANKLIGVVTKPIFPYEYEDPWIGVEIAPFEGDPQGNNLNFAYGGAHLVQGDEYVPDFDAQTDAHRNAVDGRADPNALYVVTFGGNDVRDLALTGSPTVPPAEAHAVMDEAAAKMLHEIGQLMEIGANKFVIMGIADVGLIPRYDRDDNGLLDAVEQQRSTSATDYSQYLDQLIRSEVVPALKAMGAEVTYVPLMDYVDESGTLVQGALNANIPTIAALHGLTADQLSQNILQYKDLIFYDHVHPTAQAHALLGAFAYAKLTGTPWIETLPLSGINVDYRTSAAISAAGEVDQYVVSLVAGTSYTLEMLGISSLATAGSLADPTLRLLGPTGVVIGASNDDGAGFDASLTFSVATSGNYTLQLSAVGMVAGSYVLQGAVVSGAAMQTGNVYQVHDSATVLLEGVGGIGQDVVRSSVSYALSGGSEIEVLRTTNDRGKTAINLTGNEFGQTIIGNAGNNIIEGKGGADVLTGKAGKDVFVLGDAGPGGIDRITDYVLGEIVDISQLLRVAAGTNVAAGQYVRVTTTGLIQVDLNGGGNNWVTLSNINGNGAVTVRYLSGGVATSVALSRVLASGSLAIAAAAAGIMSEPLAAETQDRVDGSDLLKADTRQGSDSESITPAPADDQLRTSLHGEEREAAGSPALPQGERPAAETIAEADRLTGLENASQAVDRAVSDQTEPMISSQASASVPLPAPAVAMPSAEMMQAIAATDAIDPAAMTHAIASLFDAGPPTVDALLNALPADTHALPVMGAQPGSFDTVAFMPAGDHLSALALAMHPDAAPVA